MADFGAELDAFRGEARDWLAANFPPSLAHSATSPFAGAVARQETSDDAVWRERMGAKGWGVPDWPTAYGGGGLTPGQTRILRDEMARIGAFNPIGGMGVMMLGPTLLEYGDETQKQRHLPPVARGELRWCQGFSEPGAGSDLAGLQTRAEDKGDHWLVNGQKIWINGGSPFCETFFTDVRVPKENLVGPLNGGWTIAKRLLQHERAGLSTAVSAARAEVKVQMPDLAKHYVGVDETGRIDDADLRRRIIDFEMEAKALRLTHSRSAAEARSNQGPRATTSILKNVGSFIRRDGAELTAEIMGYRGLAWDGDPFTAEEIAAVRNLFHSKAGTIAGGSQEVQLNIIAKRILGLPDPA